jgi:hypothetical protein
VIWAQPRNFFSQQDQRDSDVGVLREAAKWGPSRARGVVVHEVSTL